MDRCHHDAGPPPGQLPTHQVRELLRRFLTERPTRTAQAYAADLDEFARWRGRLRTDAVAQLLASDPAQGVQLLLDFAAWMRRRGRSMATIDRRMSTVRSLIRLALRQGLVHWFPEMHDWRTVAERSDDAPGDVAYVLPRHPAEIDRLDLQHYALAEALGSHHVVPITRASRVLDVGAGTGQWGYDVCQLHPGVRVIGLDLVRPKPGPPAGYRAVLGNVLRGLPFADDCFDVVHQRLLFSGIPVDAWPATVIELVRTCRPGGWVELVEGATRFEPAGPATRRLTELLLRLNRTTGLDSSSVVFASLERYLTDAGLRNVRRTTLDMPLGDWAGRVGSLMGSDIRALFTRVSPVFAARFGIARAECLQLVRAAQVEWDDHHTTYSIGLALGQKRMPANGGRRA